MSEPKPNGLLSISIAKSVRAGLPSSIVVSLERDADDGYAHVWAELSAEQFAQVLSGTVLHCHLEQRL